MDDTSRVRTPSPPPSSALFTETTLRGGEIKRHHIGNDEKLVEISKEPEYEQYYYMLVCRQGKEFCSIYHEGAVFNMNDICRQKLTSHDGGFLVFNTVEDALTTPPPVTTHMYIAPRAVLKVAAWGDFRVCPRSKNMIFSCVYPLEEIKLPIGYFSNSFQNEKFARRALEVEVDVIRSQLTEFRSPMSRKNYSADPTRYRELQLQKKMRRLRQSETSRPSTARRATYVYSEGKSKQNELRRLYSTQTKRKHNIHFAL